MSQDTRSDFLSVELWVTLALRWNLVRIFVIRANQVIYNFTLMNNTWQKILQSLLVISVLHKNRFVFNCFLQMIATRSCEAVHGGAFFYLTLIQTRTWLRKWLITILPGPWRPVAVSALSVPFCMIVGGHYPLYKKNTSALLLGTECKSSGELVNDFIFERNKCIRMVSLKLKMTSLFNLHLF